LVEHKHYSNPFGTRSREGAKKSPRNGFIGITSG
jgi:hypothetical protein